MLVLFSLCSTPRYTFALQLFFFLPPRENLLGADIPHTHRIPTAQLAEFTNGEIRYSIFHKSTIRTIRYLFFRTNQDSHHSDPEEFYVKQDRIGVFPFHSTAQMHEPSKSRQGLFR